MKTRFLLISLMLLFCINSLFAVKSAALVNDTKTVSVTHIKNEKKQTKISLFQRLMKKKINKRIRQKNTVPDKKKERGDSRIFGIISFLSSVLGLITMLIGLTDFLPLFFVGLGLVITGIVCGIIGLKRDRNIAFARGGLIISIIEALMVISLTLIAIYLY